MAPDDDARVDWDDSWRDPSPQEYRYLRHGLLWVSVPRNRYITLIYKPLPPRPDGRVIARLVEDTLLGGQEVTSEDDLRAGVDHWFDGSTKLDLLSLCPALPEIMGELAAWEGTREIKEPDMNPDDSGDVPELQEDKMTVGALRDAPGERVSYTRDDVTFVYEGGHRISLYIDAGIPGKDLQQLTEDILIANRRLTREEFEKAVDHWLECGGLARVGLRANSAQAMTERSR